MSNALVPPTWANPVIKDRVTGQEAFNPAWLMFFVQQAAQLSGSGVAGGGTTITSAQAQFLFSGDSQPITLPAVGGSPFTYQNTTGFTVNAVASGGTTVACSVSRDNITYYPFSGTAVTLGRNDYLRITYVVAPTLAIFPL